MRLLDTILVPVVFGPGGGAAVNTAQTLAHAFESKLLLLHVIPEKVYPLMADSPGIPALKRRLRELHLCSGSTADGDVDVVVDKGSAAAVICDAAVSNNADLIVIGSRGMKGCADQGIGATADRVMRKATVPVWVAHPGMPETPRHILCPVDGSDVSRRALRFARSRACSSS